MQMVQTCCRHLQTCLLVELPDWKPSMAMFTNLMQSPIIITRFLLYQCACAYFLKILGAHAETTRTRLWYRQHGYCDGTSSVGSVLQSIGADQASRIAEGAPWDRCGEAAKGRRASCQRCVILEGCCLGQEVVPCMNGPVYSVEWVLVGRDCEQLKVQNLNRK